MDINLKDKVVLVTGGAEGIGYEISNHFLLNGAKVIILDINEERGDKATKDFNKKIGENRAYFIKCNVVTDLDRVCQEIYDEYGNVDVLVNNAGVPEQDVDVVIDINLKAVIKWSFKFWQLMRKDKKGNGGTIINIASAYGITAFPHFPVYHASKFGVVGFSMSLGHELNYKRSGVRVIALCPGYTKTKIAAGVKTFDDEALLISSRECFKVKEGQEADAVGRAAVEVFEKVDSGTVWVILGGKPIFEAMTNRCNY
ncbi:15-hydroxyprostaglandin dehydrogenase [NAD(+)]-like [Epargyreus clarus]|uniref:15-hydroxyprostaglandin dehydrogenase [NAD(+)]-like n=1 Tax=Epargyreus clarus TaxID=520877 RepID=UPI003C30D391